jgi:hypothetical protein
MKKKSYHNNVFKRMGFIQTKIRISDEIQSPPEERMQLIRLNLFSLRLFAELQIPPAVYIGETSTFMNKTSSSAHATSELHDQEVITGAISLFQCANPLKRPNQRIASQPGRFIGE